MCILYLSQYLENNVGAKNLEDKLDVYKASIKFDDVLKHKIPATEVISLNLPKIGNFQLF